MGDVFATFLLIALGLLLVSAGIEDARKREIANWKNAAIALMAPLWWVANGLPVWPDMAIQLGVALVILALFAGAFAVGQMGGGDVKLIAALALWLPFQPLVWMVVLMALFGGALTAAMVIDQWIRIRAPRPSFSLPAVAALVLGSACALLLYQPDLAAWTQLHPILWATVIFLMLGSVSVLLLLGMRSARKRGLLPETPYGVAIAVAALLVLREPIFNQFG
jgi:prepilin peptidase CpaA